MQKVLQKKSIWDVRTWLYHQRWSLAQVHLLNGSTAFKEVQQALFYQINKNHFKTAINDLCKLVDIKQRPDAFYDANDYAFISLPNVYHRFCHITSKH